MAAEGLGVVAKLASGKFNAHLIFVNDATDGVSGETF